MKKQSSSNVGYLLSVIGANTFVMVVGIIQAFLFPKFMSPDQYGLWAMYLLYVGFAGFFNLGVSDGIYLIYGGKEYEDLDKSKFKSYLNLAVCYLLIFLAIWSIGNLIAAKSIEHLAIMLLVGLSSFLACLINFTTMIDQATSRFYIYSKGHIIEKIAIMIGAVFLFKWKVALVAVIASVVGRIITVFYYYSNTKPILYAKHSSYKSAITDMKEFAFAGIWITLAAICTTAMTSIGRFFIEGALGITELGYYSFILSISGLFTIFFSAIATVLFPMMRKSSEDAYKHQMSMLDNILDLIGILILLVYYPARMVLNVLYPQYAPALDCLITLFPLVLLQGRTSIIYFTIYKVERLERNYVYNLIASMAVCIGLCFGAIRLFNSISSIAVATYISFIIWSLINVYCYNKRSVYHVHYHIPYIVVSIAFLAINLLFGQSEYSVWITYAVFIPIAVVYFIKVFPDVKKIISYL